MKPWQHGYDIELLKLFEARFAQYNSYALSPFQAVKKHTIAQALHDETLIASPSGVIIIRSVAKSNTPITAYLDVVIAQKLRGDLVVHAFTFDDPALVVEYLTASTQPTWVWIWQECAEQVRIVAAAGYEYVGSKITSFAEIRGLYFKDGDAMLPRTHPAIDAAEHLGICRAAVTVDVAAAVDELRTLDAQFTNHYSNYNRRKAWSALSLRGYTDDPAFITKPSEMPPSWQFDHADQLFALQDTPLRVALPSIDVVHKPITELGAVHRIRLMKLAPHGGELTRHTDLVDKDTGIADGELARFHFPLVTNDAVFFTSWAMSGEPTSVHMRVGECWYLDTRKPHTAVNDGDTDRVHLVVDVESNEQIRELLR